MTLAEIAHGVIAIAIQMANHPRSVYSDDHEPGAPLTESVDTDGRIRESDGEEIVFSNDVNLYFSWLLNE